MNMVVLKGRLGSDPELKYTTKGTPVCRFTLATNESYRDQSGSRQNLTEWHKIVVWRKPAEVASQYLSKGSELLVRGKIRTRTWEDQGRKNYVTEIHADDFEFCGPKINQGGDRGAHEPNPDDIPF